MIRQASTSGNRRIVGTGNTVRELVGKGAYQECQGVRTMKLFEAQKKNLPYTVIAGGAGFAAALAEILEAQGSDVLVIARSQEAFRAIASSCKGRILVGDCTDMDMLRAADLEKAAMVVAATDDDNVNLLVAQLVKEVFGVQHIVAIINEPERECVYRELSVTAVSPVLISAQEIAGRLLSVQKEDSL